VGGGGGGGSSTQPLVEPVNSLIWSTVVSIECAIPKQPPWTTVSQQPVVLSFHRAVKIFIKCATDSIYTESHVTKNRVMQRKPNVNGVRG